jgi:hypothetical protein
MIMSQEQAFLKAQEQLESIVGFVRAAGREGLRIDEVERGLFQSLLTLGLTMLKAFVAGAGDGDAGADFQQDGHTLRRSVEPHTRRYLSVFGELEIRRYVYARREGQKAESVPLDAQLGLPAGEFSYVLEDWLQRLCIKESFREGVASLQMLLGLKPGIRSAEHMNQSVGSYAERYQTAQPQPQPEEEAAIFVVTADGKGVPMRRPLEERVKATPRRTKGEKANKKQMACVGAIYSIDPFVRTADDVVDELQRKARAADRPLPQHKRVWAEMTRALEGHTYNGKSLLFAEMALELSRRNPGHAKPVVCLMDGEAALWEVQRGWLPHALGILDLFHVLERLWHVSYCFHPEGSTEAQEFVTHRLRLLLQGKVGYVIGGLKHLLRQHGLQGQKRRTVLSTIGYYQNNRDHMRYDEYLAAGYPIGSGVAEGACRHVVKDRMEQTGMRWTQEGAQSMLHLRVLYLNGNWDSFINYRIECEQERLYGGLAA